ncbi:hypothetical protein ACE14D_04520 [Streptomyces sp. Act-28]
MALLLSFVFLSSSCSSEGVPEPEAHLCDVSEESAEGRLLSLILGTGQYKTTIFNDIRDVTERLKVDLSQGVPKDGTAAVEACSFLPNKSDDDGRVRVSFYWSGTQASVQTPPPSALRYGWNGTQVESTDSRSTIWTRCSMAGDAEESSRQVWLTADASNTVDLGRKRNRVEQEQHASFLYLMTRRVTAPLGCTNDPLKGKPMMEPVDSSASGSVKNGQ